MRRMRETNGVERPHWGWWVSIIAGMSLTTVLACSDAAYGLWSERVTTLFSRPLLVGIFVGAVALHVGEALYAWRIAPAAGATDHRLGWALQTLTLGFPSLRLLLARRRAAGSR
jgi:hypothetical protein